MKILIASIFFSLASCQSPTKLPNDIPSSEIKAKEALPKTTTNCICPMMWMPVCGENGKTYSNACAADCVKVKYTQGSCSKNLEE